MLTRTNIKSKIIIRTSVQQQQQKTRNCTDHLRNYIHFETKD